MSISQAVGTKSRWISLAHVANAVGGDPGNLAAACRKKGLDLDENNHRSWPMVKKSDLAELLSPDRAKSVLYGRGPDWLRAGLAGPYLPCTPSEIVGLCERRGLTVSDMSPMPEIDRGEVIDLRRILAKESEISHPVDDRDWLEGRLALPRIREIQTTQMSGGLNDWDSLDTSDPDNPQLRSNAELIQRCKWMSIRFTTPGRYNRAKAHLAYGVIHVCGFDLFRFLGIEMEGMEVDYYRELQAEARRVVLGDLPGEL